jgi:hypothetical protein
MSNDSYPSYAERIARQAVVCDILTSPAPHRRGGPCGADTGGTTYPLPSSPSDKQP